LRADKSTFLEPKPDESDGHLPIPVWQSVEHYLALSTHSMAFSARKLVLVACMVFVGQWSKSGPKNIRLCF
jgi:hypothetical protein